MKGKEKVEGEKKGKKKRTSVGFSDDAICGSGLSYPSSSLLLSLFFLRLLIMTSITFV